MKPATQLHAPLGCFISVTEPFVNELSTQNARQCWPRFMRVRCLCVFYLGFYQYCLFVRLSAHAGKSCLASLTFARFSAWCYLALLGFAGVACLAWHCLALLRGACLAWCCLASATGYAGNSCTLLVANAFSVLCLPSGWVVGAWVGRSIAITRPSSPRATITRPSITTRPSSLDNHHKSIMTRPLSRLM